MIILVISRGPFICCLFSKQSGHTWKLYKPHLGIFGRHQCRYDDHVSIAWLRNHFFAWLLGVKMVHWFVRRIRSCSKFSCQHSGLPGKTGAVFLNVACDGVYIYIIETRRMDTNGRFLPPEISFNISQAFEPLM